MTFKSEQTRKIEKLFCKSKVVTIDELKYTLNTNYPKTVFRYLKELGYLSSYNNAGRFYTLPHIPEFNEYGLWHYEVASFSKFGTLKLTICSIVNESNKGLTHRELKQLLRCRIQNTLNELTKNNVISRESINGLFVYVCAKKEVALGQISQLRVKVQVEDIDLTIIIEILFELLQSPVWDIKTIFKKLTFRKIAVTEQQIKEVFRHYNLEKKLLKRLRRSEKR